MKYFLLMWMISISILGTNVKSQQSYQRVYNQQDLSALTQQILKQSNSLIDLDTNDFSQVIEKLTNLRTASQASTEDIIFSVILMQEDIKLKKQYTQNQLALQKQKFDIFDMQLEIDRKKATQNVIISSTKLEKYYRPKFNCLNQIYENLKAAWEILYLRSDLLHKNDLNEYQIIYDQLFYRSSCYQLFSLKTNEEIDDMNIDDINSLKLLDKNIEEQISNPISTKILNDILSIDFSRSSQENQSIFEDLKIQNLQTFLVNSIQKPYLNKVRQKVTSLIDFFDSEIRDVEDYQKYYENLIYYLIDIMNDAGNQKQLNMEALEQDECTHETMQNEYDSDMKQLEVIFTYTKLQEKEIKEILMKDLDTDKKEMIKQGSKYMSQEYIDNLEKKEIEQIKKDKQRKTKT